MNYDLFLVKKINSNRDIKKHYKIYILSVQVCVTLLDTSLQKAEEPD